MAWGVWRRSGRDIQPVCQARSSAVRHVISGVAVHNRYRTRVEGIMSTWELKRFVAAGVCQLETTVSSVTTTTPSPPLNAPFESGQFILQRLGPHEAWIWPEEPLSCGCAAGGEQRGICVLESCPCHLAHQATTLTTARAGGLLPASEASNDMVSDERACTCTQAQRLRLP